MAKLRHENPPHLGPDPGAVRSVPDTTRPYKPPKSYAERKREKNEEEAKRAEARRPYIEYEKRKQARKILEQMDAEGVGNTMFRAYYQSLLKVP